MPGMDGSGPLGQGPMTGGGFGRCGGGQGMGRGRGMGGGGGKGRGGGGGRGFGFAGAGRFNQPLGPVDSMDDEESLKARLDMLEQESRAIKERLNNVDK